MCGRYALNAPARDLAELFSLDDVPEFHVRYNIAPTQEVPVVRQDRESGRREARLLRWGLIPSWAKDASIGNRMINARAEPAAEKPSFRAAFKARRCLIPATGFYEWQKTDGAKQPYHIGMADDRLRLVEKTPALGAGTETVVAVRPYMPQVSIQHADLLHHRHVQEGRRKRDPLLLRALGEVTDQLGGDGGRGGGHGQSPGRRRREWRAR